MNIKIYLPANKNTNIKGLWLNNQGKIISDNIRVLNKNNICIDDVNIFIEKIKEKYNQEAIFYKEVLTRGYIHYNVNKIDILEGLKEKIIHKGNYSELKFYVKYYLKKYRGITIFKLDNRYLLEAWHK